MAVYLTGSIAYDRIMNFPGRFAESILMDHLHILNVSFFIDNLDEQLGGNAGNIAYSLHLLQEKPVVLSTAGKDFDRYKEIMVSRGLPLHGIRMIPDNLTAGAYIITDQDNNQITAFHAAALMSSAEYSFEGLDKDDIALIGPANPGDMVAHPKVYQQKGVRYIFDPAQQLPVLSGEDLRACINGAYLLVGNDYEITLISEKVGCTRDDLISMTTRGVIITYGAKGSAVFEKGKDCVTVPVVPVGEIKDPTGAGDAFRSGLIKGLLNDLPLGVCAQLGAACSAYCIESKGPQGHTFTLPEMKARFEKTFGQGSFPL